MLRGTTEARSKRRSIHAPNLTDELRSAEERRLNQFGSAGLVWCGKQRQIRRRTMRRWSGS